MEKTKQNSKQKQNQHQQPRLLMKEAPLNKLTGHHQPSSGKDRGLQRPQSIRQAKAASAWDNCRGVRGGPSQRQGGRSDEEETDGGTRRVGRCGAERSRTEQNGTPAALSRPEHIIHLHYQSPDRWSAENPGPGLAQSQQSRWMSPEWRRKGGTRQ